MWSAHFAQITTIIATGGVAKPMTEIEFVPFDAHTWEDHNLTNRHGIIAFARP